jgi:hypothetical protein
MQVSPQPWVATRKAVIDLGWWIYYRKICRNVKFYLYESTTEELESHGLFL